MSGSQSQDPNFLKLLEILRKMILKAGQSEVQLQPFPPSVATFNSYVISLNVDYNALKNRSEIAGGQGQGDGHSTPALKPIVSEGYRFEDTGTWRLIINPDFRDKNGNRYISTLLWLSHCSADVPFFDVSYSIGILDEEPYTSIAYIKASRIRRFSKQEPLFGWDKFLAFDALGNNPPSTIRFFVTISLWGVLDPLASLKAIEFWYPKQSGFEIPEKCCRDEDRNSDTNQNKSSGTILNASRKEKRLRLWNGGHPRAPNALIKCGDTDFPIHAEILSELSTTISDHFSNQTDRFNLQPFTTPEEIDPETIRMFVTYAYLGKFDDFPEPVIFGPKPFENPSFKRLLSLWDASVSLRMPDLEPRLSAKVMESVNANFFRIPFLRYRQKIQACENRVATRKDFFGYLKELRQKGHKVLEDYKDNRVAYVKLMFKL